jgi:hypothetical protein
MFGATALRSMLIWPASFTEQQHLQSCGFKKQCGNYNGLCGGIIVLLSWAAC